MSDASPVAKSDAEWPDLTGQTIGDFQVLRRLGKGGMGQVYLARQLSLKREVALKILRQDLADHPTAHKRFQAEAEAVAKISHPNIVQVYAVGEFQGLRYMALEYIAGRNLRDFLDRKGPPELPVALAIMRQVAAALQRANETGLVHRDIKPENILLNRKVEVKVADFGLSRYFAGDGKSPSLTQSGMTLGTPLYMSPEQVQGQPVDHRSDLYSFGITAYHLLGGEPPFQGKTPFDVALLHVQAVPVPLQQLRPDLPNDLCDLVHRLMAKDPAQRPNSAKDVLRDLSRIQKGLPLDHSTNPVSSNSSQLSANSLRVSLSGNSIGSVQWPWSGGLPQAPAPSRWPWRIAGVGGVIAFGICGWWIYHQVNPFPVVANPESILGLPNAMLPDRVISQREMVLREQLKARPLTADHIEFELQLGLILIEEKRWSEAEQVFQELETIRLIRPSVETPIPTISLAKMGQAMILAQRDEAKASNDLFEAAVSNLPRQPQLRQAVERFLFENIEWARAISEALHRNAENLSPGKPQLPTNLEWLRTPSGILSWPR